MSNSISDSLQKSITEDFFNSDNYNKLNTEYQYWSEYESKYKKIKNKHKEAKRISKLYFDLAKQPYIKKSQIKSYKDKSTSILFCNTEWVYYVNKLTQEIIKSSKYCKQRFCPICNYNQELKHFRIFSEIVKKEELKDCYYGLLTLTLKNTLFIADDLPLTIQLLKDAITSINNGIRALFKDERSYLRARTYGAFITIEVTRNKKDGSFHPHVHILLALPPSYDFEKSTRNTNHINIEEVNKIWQKALNLDYMPSIDFRMVETEKQNGALAEVAKYQVKSTDINSEETLYILSEALKGSQMKRYTGLVQKLRKEVEKDIDEERIKLKDIVCDERFIKVLFKYDSFKNTFRYDRKGSERLNNKLKYEQEENNYIDKLTSECLELI